jgi:peptidyl-prolyl cis-trans isomerase C
MNNRTGTLFFHLVVIRRSAALWLEGRVVTEARGGESRLSTDADARLYQTPVPPRNSLAPPAPFALRSGCASGTLDCPEVHGVFVIKKSAVLLFLLVVAVSACKKKEAAPPAASLPAASTSASVQPGGPGAAAPAPAPPVKPVPAQLPGVVARVNGEDVKKGEIELAVKTLEDRARTAVPPEQRDTVYRQVLDRIIGFHLLVQEAKARKVVAPPWEVDAQVDQIKKQFPNEDAFKQMLQARSVTLDQLRSDTAQTIAVNLMLKHELEPVVKVTEADTRTFFDQNKARFRQDDAVHASHILIRVPEQADVTARAKAKTQAGDILAQLKKGAAFADLAKKYSQDPGSAPNGGDLGFFSKGQMVPAFEQAAFGLKPGQTSGVVESPFGYHIIRVSEVKAGRDLGYDEVKAQIEEYLKQQAREKKSEEFVDRLRAKGKVEILL